MSAAMSAAVQFPVQWPPRRGTLNIAASAALQPNFNPSLLASAVHHIQRRLPKPEPWPEPVPELVPALVPASIAEAAVEEAQDCDQDEPINTWAFYRKHTENLLRRYLYASMQVGRSPNLLSESVGRGWVSSRRVRTFEDALIFVLDVERCLSRLDRIDRQLITRRILQEYTHQESANILGLTLRAVTVRLPQAVDHLTEVLVENDLLTIPD
jgi:hypothetical protein